VLTEIHGYKEAFEGGAPKYPTLEPHSVESAVHHALIVSFHANRLVEVMAPWKLATQKSEQEVLDSVLYYLAESLRIIAILISPVLPKAAHGILDQLSWKRELSGKEERFCLEDAKWGGLPDGHVVGKPVPLFPRIETK
jgi:methionyl-tRNA synthetase